MNTESLLVEILTEELPPKNLSALSQSFTASLHQGLSAYLSPKSVVTPFATPRRLAVHITQVLSQQDDQNIERKGPAVSAAFTAQGEPTPALQGFARSCGVAISALQKKSEGGREFMMATLTQRGKSLAELMPELMESAIRALPIAKNMRWGDLQEGFVRPVHALTLLYGATILPFSKWGLSANRHTAGHRVLGAPHINIPHADDYEKLLMNEGGLIPRYSTRRALIDKALHEMAAQGGEHSLVDNPALLDEVTALTESPSVLEGRFDEAFLQVPQEALMVSMTQHQKYFPVVDKSGRLTSRFLIVANMHATPTIRAGNERVLRARLSDAQFFYRTDCATSLADKAQGLAQVTHLQELGSMAQRVDRIEKVAQLIHASLSTQLAASHPMMSLLPKEINRACVLCKADLQSGLVGEFPELQGIAGDYYARHDGESHAVARAIREHYAPRFSGDRLPSSPLGQLLSLADKWEALSGLFGINRIPTGDKDPFGARRAALGVLRLLMEENLPLDLTVLFNAMPHIFANTGWKDKHQGGHTQTLLSDFLYERLRYYLREEGASTRQQGFEPSLIEAVLAQHPTRLDSVLAQLQALETFVTVPGAARLIAMGKRIRNILKQNPAPEQTIISPSWFVADSEKTLFDQMNDLTSKIDEHIAHRELTQALMACLPLDEPLAKFFDEVMVMDDNLDRRHNRLAVLKKLDALLNAVGVLGEIRWPLMGQKP